MPSRKEKDATRSERKAKRRVLEDRIPDLPFGADENISEDFNVDESTKKKRSRDTADADDDTQKRASKKARKNDEQSKEAKSQKNPQRDDQVSSTEQDGVTELRKSKKERKAERKALQAAAEDPETSQAEKEDSAYTDAGPKVTMSTEDHQRVGKMRHAKLPPNSGENEEMGETSGKAPRFIVFVGRSMLVRYFSRGLVLIVRRKSPVYCNQRVDPKAFRQSQGENLEDLSSLKRSLLKCKLTLSSQRMCDYSRKRTSLQSRGASHSSNLRAMIQ